MADSEIADLCRRIYKRHKPALDLIFEHKPDLEWDIAQFVKKLVGDAAGQGIRLEGSSKSSIRFYLDEWQTIAPLNQGSGWTQSGQLLLFEVQNYAGKLQLTLIIGPGPAPAREALYSMAQKQSTLCKGRTQQLYPKFTTIFKRKWLTGKDYDEQDWESVEQKLQNRWRHFLEADLPDIREAINAIKWP